MGIKNNVKAVEKVSPPITASAKGACVDSPPNPIAIGINPSTVAREVIKIGFNRVLPPRRTALCSSIPDARSLLEVVSKIPPHKN